MLPDTSSPRLCSVSLQLDSPLHPSRADRSQFTLFRNILCSQVSPWRGEKFVSSFGV